MAWLGTWAKRIKITIDSTVVDANQTWFPVPVYLSSSSGSGNDDVTAIFDELQNDANRKKIAITQADGITQLYVEIERWDDASEQAWLWVSRSGWTVASGADTEIYIYYDTGQPDNNAFVADSGARTEVWNGDFVMVQHLEETSGAHIDSTSNNNDSVTVSVTVQGTAPGQIDGADDFEAGNTDYVAIGAFALSGSFAVEFWLKPETTYESDSAITTFIANMEYTAGQRDGFEVYYAANPGVFRLGLADGTNDRVSVAVAVTLTAGTWYRLVAAFDDAGNESRLFVNLAKTTAVDAGTHAASARNMHIGNTAENQFARYTDGIIDEVRIYDIPPTDAWLKASYYAGLDTLIKEYGTEELGRIPRPPAYGLDPMIF